MKLSQMIDKGKDDGQAAGDQPGKVAPAAPAEPGAGTGTARANRGGAVFSRPIIPISTALAVAVVTLLASRLGQAPDSADVFWVANAVAAGAWLRSGRGRAFDLSFGALIAFGIMSGKFLSGYSQAEAALLTLANMIEIVAAVLLVRWLLPGLALVSVHTAMRLLMALTGAAIIGGAAGAFTLALIRDTPLATGFPFWVLGHFLGLVIVTPLILSLDRRTLESSRNPRRVAEAVLLVGTALGLTYLLSFHVPAPLAFLINPLLLVIAVRLRVNGLTVAMLGVSVCVLGSVLNGFGPAITVGQPLETRIFLAQLLLTFTCVPYLLVASLIEERDRLWAQARAGLARAERASEAKSRLLANVAHEIKSPIAGVIGIGEMWSAGQLGKVDSNQAEMAVMLVRTARQVETLAHDLLDVARAEAGTVKVELRPVEVLGLVEDVRRTASLRPEAQGVSIEIISEAARMVARADSQRLFQVIDNLAVNALKYAGAGRSLTFRIGYCALGVRIEVADKGPGISLEKQALLFEPFNRLGLERSSIEGHGVGLALASRLVELQGGEIGVISVPGEGATFWVELPSP